MPRPAVFLDRDGVLNVYRPEDYVKSVAELVLLPDVGEAVARLNRAAYPVFIISNQQGVAKGVMTHDDLSRVEEALLDGLQTAGGTIERSYYCTAHASENSEDRKPRPGMILRAARDYDIDLAASVFIGDTETDAAAARAAGVGTFILVLTGKHTDPAVASDAIRFPLPPDFVADSLMTAVLWLLKR